MTGTPVVPSNWPTPKNPLTPAFRAGDLVFIGGLGGPTDGDLAVEVNGIFEKLETILGAAGGSLRDLVKVNAFLSHTEHFAGFNDAYVARIDSPPPARTTVVVKFPNPAMRVEIEAVAHIPLPRD